MKVDDNTKKEGRKKKARKAFQIAVTDFAVVLVIIFILVCLFGLKKTDSSSTAAAQQPGKRTEKNKRKKRPSFLPLIPSSFPPASS